MQSVEGMLHKIEEDAMRGSAFLTGGVPKEAPWTLSGNEEIHAGRAGVGELLTVGQT